MSEPRNVFQVERGWRSHALFKNEEYTRACAWLWLIENACFAPSKFNVKGKIVEVNRGQLFASRSQLSKAWGWPESKVERFLTRLKTEQMIGQETGQGISLITICNYDIYQFSNHKTGQATGQAIGQGSDRHRTAKEEDKEDKEIILVAKATVPSKKNPTPDDIQKAVELWNTAASKTGWPTIMDLPPQRRSKLSARLKEHGIDGWYAALRKAYGSPMLGRSPPSWFTFNFLIKNSENILKVLEGNYDKSFGSTGQSASQDPVFDRLETHLFGDLRPTDPGRFRSGLDAAAIANG